MDTAQNIVIPDRDDSALLETQFAIDGTGLLASQELVLCDTREGKRICRLVKNLQRDVVLNTAALRQHLVGVSKSKTAKLTSIRGISALN